MPKCPLGEISKDEIRWFASYWMSKCRDHAVPRRDDMAPEDLAKVYSGLDLVWAGDFMEAGFNSAFCSPEPHQRG